MTIEACYAALGGDYAGVLARLQSPRLVQKFMLKFPDDGSFDLLIKSLREGDLEEAFRAAHTIKGVCQNLSFTQLGHSSEQLTEVLRAGNPPDEALLSQVSEDYHRAVDAIRAFAAAQ